MNAVSGGVSRSHARVLPRARTSTTTPTTVAWYRSNFRVMPHLLDLSLELLPLALLDLTHRDLARVDRVCSALRIAVGEVRRVCERLNIEDIGLTPYDITLVPLGSPLRVNCIAPIAGKDDPHDRVPALLSGIIHRSLTNLLELRLAGLAGLTDTCISSELTPRLMHLPRLCVLDLSSTAVGTLGVMSLRTLTSLQELHLIHCPMVSYTAVLCLRTSCPRLRLIRRLPVWACGTFETPWGEEHTYWPCGAFSFRRAIQSTGFVAQLRARKGGGYLQEYLENRLAFVDIEPEDAVINGRIGVCLRSMRDGSNSNVLVWQDREVPEPRPRLGPHVPPQLTSGHGLPAPGQLVHFDNFIVSTMVVRTHQESEDAAPPSELDSQLRAFCFDRHAPDGLRSLTSSRGEAEAVAFWSIYSEAAELRAVSDKDLELHSMQLRRELKAMLECRVRQCLTCASGASAMTDGV